MFQYFSLSIQLNYSIKKILEILKAAERKIWNTFEDTSPTTVDVVSGPTSHDSVIIFLESIE